MMPGGARPRSSGEPAATVLVHGGGGFVGGAIMRALSRTPDLLPLAGLRRRPNQQPPWPYVICDATDRTAMSAAARGARFAVNAVLGDAATMLAATRNLCAAAREAGMARIVHISTMSVYGAVEGLVTETAPLRPDSAYGAAKAACEAVVADYVASGGDAVILRPGIVYGPGGEQWAGRLGRMLRARRLGDLGAAGDGLCNLIYHDDVGAAVAAALVNPAAKGQVINLGPVSPPTWNEVLVRLACATGATPVRRVTARRLRTEARGLAPMLQCLKLAAGRLGARAGAWPEPLPPSLLALMRQRIALDPSKADALLGFARTPGRVGLAACAGWIMEGAR